ncbi:MAG: DUF7931 domain-containing protein [Acidiferrobacterales bacterium]
MTNNADQKKAGGPERPAAARDVLREAIGTLLEQAQHDILVFGPTLDGYYFNTERTAEALRQFIARHHGNRARFLVAHGQQVIRDNARLVALARRFADAVQLRRVSDDHAGLRELFVVIDRRAWIFQQDADCIDQPVSGQQPRQAALLARRFCAMWDRGEPLAEITAAGL